MYNGKISLTTPEGIRLLQTPAGPVPRAWAWLIDFLLFFVVMLLMWTQASGRTMKGLLLVATFVVYWGYPVLCEVYFNGRTVGKKIMGLQVVRADGLPVGWRESCLRNLLLVADFMPVFYTTGLVCMLFDPHFRRVGDLVAHTQVVYFETPAQPKNLQLKLAPHAPPFPLTPEQQRSLIDLLERADSIPPAQLLELASLAEPLTGKTDEASLQELRHIVAGIQQ